ncbi:hypothetical protein ABZZ79_15445 [Streptomyces sp. NPDC006458]|uniref:hypothetical protein n=1 Tax=Streptomyces sp. NPDC006458 TaxID=3154302 RepID=UPI0033B33633
MGVAFAASAIGLMVIVGFVFALIAGGVCALCVGFAARMLRGLFAGNDAKKS